MSENREIWDQVCSTPPKDDLGEITKLVDFRKDYQYTAIDPQWQLERATELWGPMGRGWGMYDVKITLFDVEAFDKQAGKHYTQKQMMLEAKLWYGEGNCFVPVVVDMPYRPNSDTCKKLLTAARSKALSCLGFNNDIYRGKYEDHEYVAGMKTRFGDQEEIVATALAQVRLAQDAETLAHWKDRIEKSVGKGNLEPSLARRVLKEIEAKSAELFGDTSPPSPEDEV